MPRPVSNPFAPFMTPPVRLALDQTDCRYTRSQLFGFAGYVCREGLTLADVRQEHLLAYGAECEALGLARPKQVTRDAAHAWNRMIGKLGWPKTQLVPPSSTRASIRYQDLPEALRQDGDTYFGARAGHGDDDLFNESAPEPLAAATLKDRKGKLCQLVAHYVEGGGKLKDLQSLSDLTSEAAIRRILGHIWEKAGRKRNAHGANLARLLRLIAQHHCKAPRHALDMIRAAEKKLQERQSGMTDKNKKRLRTILEDKHFIKFLRLPMITLDTVDPTAPTLTDALAIQSALAMQILLEAPMRAKNLAELDLDRHFDFVSDMQCHIDIEADDVKNDQVLSYVLGENFCRLFRLYVDIYRPLLLGEHTSSALFISRHGRHKNAAELASQLQRFIQEGVGLRMNVHLFRHLTGYIYLRHHPGEYEPIRQLLGHKDLRTTVNFYVVLEEDAAFKRYGAILDQLISKGGFDDDGN